MFNNLSEQLSLLVKRDGMRSMYGAKETVFSKVYTKLVFLGNRGM